VNGDTEGLPQLPLLPPPLPPPPPPPARLGPGGAADHDRVPGQQVPVDSEDGQGEAGHGPGVEGSVVPAVRGGQPSESTAQESTEEAGGQKKI